MDYLPDFEVFAMILKKTISILLTVFLLAALLLPAPALALEEPVVRAKAAILMNAESGEIYYGLHEDQSLPPASTTKVMTSLLALEAVERGDVALSDVVTASTTFQVDLEADGSTANIAPGEMLSLEDLLYCALVCSANEACNIIAEYVSGGSLSAFVAEMNARAKELGCTHTHFSNAHGLPAAQHYTSAHDLAIITAAALRFPKFVEIVNTVSREIEATNLSDKRVIRTSNNLINPDQEKYFYREASGVKTGSTSEAGYCLISSTEVDGETIVSVVLGCEAIPQADQSYEIQSFTESKTLLQWMQKNYAMRTVVSVTDLVCEVPVLLGEGTDAVVVRPESGIEMLLPKDLDLASIEKKNVVYSLEAGAEPVTAPVSAGQVLGEMTLRYQGKELGPIPLVANTSVSLSRLAYIKNQIHEVLSQSWVKWTFFGFIAILVLYFVFVIRYNIVKRKRRRAAYEAAKRGGTNAAPRIRR